MFCSSQKDEPLVATDVAWNLSMRMLVKHPLNKLGYTAASQIALFNSAYREQCLGLIILPFKIALAEAEVPDLAEAVADEWLCVTRQNLATKSKMCALLGNSLNAWHSVSDFALLLHFALLLPLLIGLQPHVSLTRQGFLYHLFYCSPPSKIAQDLQSVTACCSLCDIPQEARPHSTSLCCRVPQSDDTTTKTLRYLKMRPDCLRHSRVHSVIPHILRWVKNRNKQL